MFAFEICNLPRITEFSLKFRINLHSLSQLESSKFSLCVIMYFMWYFNLYDTLNETLSNVPVTPRK